MKLSEIILSTNTLRRRQYAIKRVSAVEASYSPQNKQLQIVGQALPTESTTGGMYKLRIVFNGITSSDMPDKDHPMPFSSNGDQVDFYLSQPTVNNKVQVRCSCQDFYFMWSYYDKKNKALVGPHKNYIRKTAHYPPRNPSQTPGLCKHQIALVKNLMDSGLLKKNVKMYQIVSRKPKPL